MTNREYLEFAAKAAGIVGEYESWTYQGFNEGIRQVLNGIKCWKPWNPLTDDGDALRLAVKCAQLFGFYRFLRAWLIAMATENGSPADPCAATRRAIVRAAAEIGKGMK